LLVYNQKCNVVLGVNISISNISISISIPGQLVEDTFVSQMAKMWNGLPEEIKTVTIKIKAKSMMRNFCE
jgi:hypothetical protein